VIYLQFNVKIIQVYLTYIHFKITKFYHYTSDSQTVEHRILCLGVSISAMVDFEIENPGFIALCRLQHIFKFNVRIQ